MMPRSTVFLDFENRQSITTLENISQRLVKHHHAIRHYLQMNCRMIALKLLKRPLIW